MGWFDISEQGHSFAKAESGEDLVWGDGPADILGDALSQIRLEFARNLGRLPSVAEIRAGFEFTFAAAEEEYPAAPSVATTVTDAQADALTLWGEKTAVPYSEFRTTAWQHVNGVLEALKPVPVEVPDSPQGLEEPF